LSWPKEKSKTSNQQLALFEEAKSPTLTDIDVQWLKQAKQIDIDKLDDLIVLQVVETLKEGIPRPLETKVNSMMVTTAREILKCREIRGGQGRLLPDSDFIDVGLSEQQNIALVHEIADAVDRGENIKDVAASKALTEFDTYVASQKARRKVR
jgi:hypothetical protein